MGATLIATALVSLLSVLPSAAAGVDGGAAKSDAGGISPFPPDPSPLAERHQWVFDLRYERGEVRLLGISKVDSRMAQATPRMMGRFALELYEGHALIERVRFDFPLLGAGVSTTDGGPSAPPSFETKLRSRASVAFPATSRGTRLELWDRAMNRRFPLPWPPEGVEVGGVRGDAGIIDAEARTW